MQYECSYVLIFYSCYLVRGFLIGNLAFVAVFQIYPTTSTSVTCWFENATFYEIGDQVTCLMNYTSRVLIVANDTTLNSSRDDSITGLSFANNRNILFLPIKVSEVFPYLAVLYAFGCSIETISKKNFEKMGMLKYLDLAENYIEKIPSNSFMDLKSLEILNLSKTNFISYSGLTEFKNRIMV